MSSEMISVRLMINDPKIRGSLEKILSSTAGFHLQNSNPSGYCDLSILEIGEDPKAAFASIQSLQASGAAGSIFLTSPSLEPTVLITALRAGAKEFFAQPLKEEEVRSALRRFKEGRVAVPPSPEKKRKGKIIHLMASKGGVGATTIAVNLAAEIAALGQPRSVALVDMNLTFGEIPVFLDIKSSFDWGEVVKNISRVDATLLKSILFKHPCGVCVLPSPTGLDGVNPATPEVIERLLRTMQEIFDFIVVDGGQSIDPLSLKVLEMADQVLLVAHLSLPCLTNAKRLLWTFQRLGYPAEERVGIVINRYQKSSLISLKEAEQSLNHKIFWQIPNDFQTTLEAINQGKIISQLGNRTEICKNLQKLALSFLEEDHSEKEKPRFWNKIIGVSKESRP